MYSLFEYTRANTHTPFCIYFVKAIVSVDALARRTTHKPLAWDVYDFRFAYVLVAIEVGTVYCYCLFIVSLIDFDF